MVKARRDNRLIDAIEAVDPVVFEGNVWRLVRDGRDPLICSASGGRWDDGTFDVLYPTFPKWPAAWKHSIGNGLIKTPTH